ncbi:MAG TPA: D-glucuronyl C5-epimerase family protein [Solirubrobacteraceae bacterium]|nr:D-glucuronyl C5-epimerase family protein [Solirubrobacteraceae bacterium]
MRRALVVVALAAAVVPVATAGGSRRHPDPVRVVLARLAQSKAAPADQLVADRALYGHALATVGRLGGVRKRELRSVLRILRGMAKAGALTPGRLPLVFMTLRRNVEWWSQHGPPVPGSPGEKDAQGRKCRPLSKVRAHASRLSFPGSALVWQYYPGMGLQLQVNGTFGLAGALLRTTNPEKLAQGAQILDEMRPLATTRGGALTWEYLFPFGGGQPPWASGLAQATAIEAYLAGAKVLGRPELADFARRLVELFHLPPPAGVNVRLARDGSWYALYTFAPHVHVLNAQLDAVIALSDLAQATQDGDAAFLAEEGLRATRRRIHSFDTGKWSRYSEPGPLADLNYHVLNRDLSRELCKRTGQGAICKAWHSFSDELEARCPRPQQPAPPPQPAPAPQPAPPPAPAPGGAPAPS